MSNIIIGISGKAGSGKDTVASYLVNSYNFKQVSFATHVKNFCFNVFGFTEKQLWGSSSNREQVIEVDWSEAAKRLVVYTPEWLGFLGHTDKFPLVVKAFDHLHVHYTKSLTARIAQQYIGTELGRNMFGKSVWVDATMQSAATAMASGWYNGVVASDARFLNELDAIHADGGKVVKLLRNAGAKGTGIEDHISETEQDTIPTDNFDFIINNTGTLESLYSAIDTFMELNNVRR